MRRFVATSLTAALVLGSATVGGGCSFVAVQSPHKDDRGRLEAGDCTTSYVAPALDGIFVVVPLVGAAYVSDQSDSGYGSKSHDGTVIAGVTLAALFGISALYGVSSVGNCRAARGLAPGGGPAPRPLDANRRAEEAAEEAAVRARVNAKAAADARSTSNAGANPDAGAPDGE
jgi:hypothetical protein